MAVYLINYLKFISRLKTFLLRASLILYISISQLTLTVWREQIHYSCPGRYCSVIRQSGVERNRTLTGNPDQENYGSTWISDLLLVPAWPEPGSLCSVCGSRLLDLSGDDAQP